ncbi:uncharacterized protein LOC113562271 [Ooceraea biroi]|uniref:uncharacterized protein LOC113562271 n=1 Tax=Ooceraea biroi TaxID=2015173 RepID=UPI000F080EBA|nr:uncharacterized protein LOC113562271 [Ooceraea biroi]
MVKSSNVNKSQTENYEIYRNNVNQFVASKYKWWQFCCILLSLCVMTSCQSSILDMPIAVDLLRVIRNWGLSAFGKSKYINFEGRTGMDENYLQLARSAGKVQKAIPDYVPFPCNVTVGRSSKVPDSVHKLRPGDIDVLGAMGDSVTAGAGVFGTNTFHIAVDNRGATAVAGGQGTWKQYLTVPNILKVNHEARRRFSWNHLTNRARRDCAGAAVYFIFFRWQEIDMEIATYPEFQRDDFVVVAQPVLMDLTIPLKSNGKVDLTYLSADCFHISQKLNAWCKSHKTY